MIKTTIYTDEESGEIKKHKQEKVGVQFDEEKGYLFWNRKGHNKIFHEIELPSCLSWNDKGRLLELSRHVWSNTNLLAYRGNGGIKPYGIDKIQEIIQLKDRQTREFMKKMMDNNIIAKVNIEIGNEIQEHFYLNPIYFFSGNRIPLNLYLIFKESLDVVLPDWVKMKFKEKENN